MTRKSGCRRVVISFIALVGICETQAATVLDSTVIPSHVQFSAVPSRSEPSIEHALFEHNEVLEVVLTVMHPKGPKITRKSTKEKDLVGL